MENELNPIQQIITGYPELLKHPKNVVGKMSYDEYCEWLEEGSLEDLIEARKVFDKDDLQEHIKVMDIYIKKLQK